MLRIVQERDDAGGIVLRLEGQLVGRWVALLRQLCEEHGAGAGSAITLDLSSLRFASDQGVELLRGLQERGVACKGWRPLLRALCDRKE